MKKIILKIILLVSIATIGLVTLLTLPSAHAATLSDIDIKEEYMLNDTLSIPKAIVSFLDVTFSSSLIYILSSSRAFDLLSL